MSRRMKRWMTLMWAAMLGGCGSGVTDSAEELSDDADLGFGDEALATPPSSAVTPPRVISTSPENGATNVLRNTAIAAEVFLPRPDQGVDSTTLSDRTVTLTSPTGARVGGVVNTDAVGGCIIFQPASRLASGTRYTFSVTSGVKDKAGISFTPFSTTFTTGTSDTMSSFRFTASSATGELPTWISSLAVSPSGSHLYAVALDGKLRRWSVNATTGALGAIQELALPALSGRVIMGIAFQGASTLWISHNDPLPAPGGTAANFTGKVSKLTLGTGTAFTATLRDYVVGLPRSAKDHLSNSIAFGPDGALYLSQGSNSAMGARDAIWGNRDESCLSAAILRIDTRRTTGLPVNVRAQSCSDGYNPGVAGAPVTLYATGVRNAFDLVWHSSSKLLVPNNGSAAGGNTPAGPAGSGIPALTGVGTQNDHLYYILPGKYYGHPNPARGEFVLNGGNPTSGRDLAEVVSSTPSAGYPVGVAPPARWGRLAFDFGAHYSPNGVLEYKSSTLGTLRGKLLVARYSAGDDILVLDLVGSTAVSRGSLVTLSASGASSPLVNPLDLVEDVRNGRIYVTEFLEPPPGTSAVRSRIRLLTPRP